MKTKEVLKEGLRPTFGVLVRICYSLIVLEQDVVINNAADENKFIDAFKTFIKQQGYCLKHFVQGKNDKNIFTYTINGKTLTIKEGNKNE